MTNAYNVCLIFIVGLNVDVALHDSTLFRALLMSLHLNRYLGCLWQPLELIYTRKKQLLSW